MFFVLVDIGCSECGEASNIVGIFTSKEKAIGAKEIYCKENRLEENEDHELLIYQIDEVDKIYNNSYEHLV
ncbi:hypothetical protein ACLM5H_09980 [Fredinandcohnia humi]